MQIINDGIWDKFCMFDLTECQQSFFTSLDLVHLDGLEDVQYASSFVAFCTVLLRSAFRFTTLKAAFSYYLVFPVRALLFLFVPVFNCVP